MMGMFELAAPLPAVIGCGKGLVVYAIIIDRKSKARKIGKTSMCTLNLPHR
jgi:hypothetical protein